MHTQIAFMYAQYSKTGSSLSALTSPFPAQLGVRDHLQALVGDSAMWVLHLRWEEQQAVLDQKRTTSVP